MESARQTLGNDNSLVEIKLAIWSVAGDRGTCRGRAVIYLFSILRRTCVLLIMGSG